MRIVKPIEVSGIEITDESITGTIIVYYPNFLHHIGENISPNPNNHVFRWNFTLHRTVEKSLLAVRDHLYRHSFPKLLKTLANDCIDVMFGFNCGFPIRDVILYFLSSSQFSPLTRGGYELAYSGEKARIHMFYYKATKIYHAVFKGDVMGIQGYDRKGKKPLKNFDQEDYTLLSFIRQIFLLKSEMAEKIKLSDALAIYRKQVGENGF